MKAQWRNVMKKFLLAAVAASTLFAVPANAADFGRNDHRTSYQAQSRANDRNRTSYQTQSRVNDRDRAFRKAQSKQAHRWARGQRFDRRYASNYQVIGNYRTYHLQAPPRGYRYVRANNDILLVGIASGLIASVLAGHF
jgi:Ni/Co efflux regulator RcnB